VRRFAVVVFAGTFFLLWLGFLQAAVAQSNSSSSVKSAPARATSAKKRTAASASTKKKRKKISPHVRRVRQAFVASASLRPMAQQLLADRTPSAYAGVEAFARCHPKEDAGALAWLVLGYAHTLDHDYAKAIDPFNRAKAGASELGDYVAYYLGDAYLKTVHNAEALSTLADFSKNFPDSLLIRDAHLVYANALLGEGRAQEAADLLEKDRAPVRADVELAIGRAYAAAGDNQKAASAFRNLYYNLPTSFEADVAGTELHKLGISGSVAARRTRADLLFKARRYSDAAHDYHDLVEEVTPADRPALQLALASALEKSDRSHDARQLLLSMGAQTGDAEARSGKPLHELVGQLDVFELHVVLQGAVTEEHVDELGDVVAGRGEREAKADAEAPVGSLLDAFDLSDDLVADARVAHRGERHLDALFECQCFGARAYLGGCA